ncbi:MAG: ADP-glyceromanno-heptose 6-epimerase [Pseudomonadota bacterium]
MTHPAVLVTGGAGFIGSNIVARLARDRSLDVVVCDRLGESATGKWRNLAKHPIADLVAPEDLWAWLAAHGGPLETVIHMGAVSSTIEPDADRVLAANFGFSRDLFRWCADHQRRFIYASSAAVYGDGSLGFDDSEDFEYLAGLRPLNAYGWSKALFDVFVARQAARGRAPPRWAGLKLFNVYGPNEGHKGAMRSVASQIWPDVAAGRGVRLFRSLHPDYPDGGQMRDFVYVRDVAEVVAWLVGEGTANGIFNLGSGEARTFNDLAEAVFKAAGREPRIEYIDVPEAVRDKYQYFTEAPMSRLRQAGWKGAVTRLEDGVADYIGSHLSRPDPYR